MFFQNNKGEKKKEKIWVSVLFIHRRKIKSPNDFCKAEEKGNGFVSNRPGSVDVQTEEIRHQSDLSTREHLNPKWIGVKYDGTAVENKI